MIQVRKGVFETNSSSVHAICISNKPVVGVAVSKTVSIYPEEFGWENSVYHDFDSKLSYLSAAINEDTVLRDRFEKLLNELGITQVGYILNNDGWFPWGYIDHNHDTVYFVDFVLFDKQHLYQFLFSSDSYVRTGNDNDNHTPEEPADYDGVCFIKRN